MELGPEAFDPECRTKVSVAHWIFLLVGGGEWGGLDILAQLGTEYIPHRVRTSLPLFLLDSLRVTP